MHQEIKSKAKELSSGAAKTAKAVDTARNTTQKQIELLGQHSAAYSSTGGKIEAHNDPYVLQRGIQYRLHKQVLEENNSRQDLIAVQRNFETFEAHVVQTIQQAMGSYLQYIGAQTDRQKALYSDIVATAQRIPPEFEWMNFLHRSGNLLIDPAAPPRDMRSISYPNQDHDSTKPLIAGTLERKSRGVGALTGYKTGFYVVTPSKYLHQYADDDSFRKDPTPDLSLYLPDCTIGAVSDTKFNIKGKDASKGKVGSAFQMSHELAFKAHTPADAQKWHGIISGCSAVTTNEPPSSAVTSPISPTGSGPTSPISPTNSGNRVVSNPPAYAEKHPAPIQTENLPASTAVASTAVATSAGGPAQSASTSAGQTSAAPQSTGVVTNPTTPATTTTASPGAAALGKEVAK